MADIEPVPLIQANTALDLTGDEKTMAALSHAIAGVLGMAFVGIIVPLIIYLAYDGRSKYVRFHALQALVFQFVGAAIVWVVGTLTCFAGFLLWPLLVLFQLFYAWKAWQGSWEAYPLLEKLGR